MDKSLKIEKYVFLVDYDAWYYDLTDYDLKKVIAPEGNYEIMYVKSTKNKKPPARFKLYGNNILIELVLNLSMLSILQKVE